MIEEILTIEGLCGEAGGLRCSTWDGKDRYDSLSIVSGLYGNEINGTYVALQLSNFLSVVEAGNSKDYRLIGKVQIIPVVNFLAFEEGNKNWAFDDYDLNFAFPGNSNGEVSEKICQEVLKLTMDATFGVILKSGNSCYRNFPHVKIWNSDRKLKKAANSLGLSTMKECEESPQFQTQLIRFWSDRQIHSMALSFGKLGALDLSFCRSIIDGMVNMMVDLEILEVEGKSKEKNKTPFFGSGDQALVLAVESGFFVPEIQLGSYVEEGQVIGNTFEVHTGKVLEKVRSLKPGLVVSLRDYPVIYQGEVLAEILITKKGLSFWPF